jgi:hypothetical protein
MEAEMDVRKLREQVVLTSSPSGRRCSESGEIRFSDGGGGGRAASLDMDGAADSTYSGGGGAGAGGGQRGSVGSGGIHDSGGAEVGCCNLNARNPRVDT